MVNHFSIFKKAKKLIDEEEVFLAKHKKTKKGYCYFFVVKDYHVTLIMEKLNDTKTSIWKREFTCDCRASIRAADELCSHAIACITYLTLNPN